MQEYNSIRKKEIQINISLASLASFSNKSCSMYIYWLWWRAFSCRFGSQTLSSRGRYCFQYDHKLLTFADDQNPNWASTHQYRHFDYISQITTQIVHSSGFENVIAFALSRKLKTLIMLKFLKHKIQMKNENYR